MRNITNTKLLYAKAFLLVATGLLAALALFLEMPTGKVAFLLAIAVWCFARAYYFAFYVIEHYVDPTYRFSGLWSFARYIWRKRKESEGVPL